MTQYADSLEAWLSENAPGAQFSRYEISVHSVDQAVLASGFPIDEFTKSIAMVTTEGHAVVAVVPATKRASTDRVRKALELAERPRLATPEESLSLLGQELGGISPLNLESGRVLIDPSVFEPAWVVVGGGDDRCLIRIRSDELRRVAVFEEVRVRN